MMEGRNSVGHTIQLLNHGDVAQRTRAQQQQHPAPAAAKIGFNLPSLASSHLLQHHQRHQQQQLTQPHPHSQHRPQHQRHDSTASVSAPAYFDSAAARHRLSRAASSSSCSVASASTSTPASPRTPLLERSGSSDSRGFSTPSPSTPPFPAYDHHHQRYYLHPVAASAHAKMDVNDPANQSQLYPPIPDAALPMAHAYPHQLQAQHPAAAAAALHIQPQVPAPINLSMQSSSLVTDSSDSPASESHGSAASASASGLKKANAKKNQYPCPMAKQVGCNDFFTTSGHAARHAKKHTGKKDAFCPECNKAFTRKDNMEQHRRTHQNGRGASRSTATTVASATAANTDDAKVKKQVKPSAKKTSVRAESHQLEAAVEQILADEAAVADAMNSIQPSVLPLAAQMTQAQAIQPVHAMQQPNVDQAILLPPSGPYFLPTLDSGPIPALPNSMPDFHLRPTLQRSNFTSSLDYVPPLAPLMGGGMVDDSLHFSYPSPGLSNGLSSLALAASERRRLSEDSSGKEGSSASVAAERATDKSCSSPNGSSSADATPTTETPGEPTP